MNTAKTSTFHARIKWDLSTTLFIAVMVLGAALRFFNLGLVRFNYDNAYPLYDALRILDGKELLLIGQPTSVFLDNPIGMSYLQALPLLVWRSPWAVCIFIVTLNVLAIGFVYRAGQRLLGDAVGFLAALLLAINPWIVYFSLTTWLPALLPFFTAFIAWSVWPTLATDQRQPNRILLGGLAFTVMTQTYLQALGVLAQILPVLWIFRRRVPRRAFYVAALVFTIAMAVYGMGVWGKFEGNLDKAQGFLSPDSTLAFTREGFDHAVRLVSGDDFEYVWARDDTPAYQTRHAATLWGNHLLKLALALGVLRALVEIGRKGPHRDVAVILVLWFAIPIGLMSFSAFAIHGYYLLISCPAGHFLAAWGLAWTLKRARLRYVLAALLVGLTVLFGLNLYHARQQVARAPTVPGFDGWELNASARVGATIRALTRDAPGYPIRIYADGHRAIMSAISATYVAPIKNLHFPDYIVLPGQTPLLYVLVDTAPAIAHVDVQGEQFPEREVVLDDGTRVDFWQIAPYDEESARRLPATQLNWPSEAGLTLLGYTLPSFTPAGQCIEGVFYWRVETPLPPGYGEWFVGAFYRLYNADGAQVSEYPGRGQWGYEWQSGDVYVERICMPAPPDAGDYTLVFGLFDPIHQRGFTLIAPDAWLPTVSVPVTIEP